MKKKRKENEVLEDSNLPVKFSFDSSYEHEIINGRRTKKKKRKEILKDSTLPISKKKTKEKGVKKPTTVFYVSKVNFLSLINIWLLMEDVGSLRYCWESTEEAYIQKVKKELKNNEAHR